MLKETEREIAKYFSKKWQKKDILFWINKIGFEIDGSAIDKNLHQPILNFIARGGKRWRPVLFLTTLKLLGENWHKYMDIAFVLELAHNATLIIDDIEDSATLRRGKPASHIIFGTDIAINSGLVMHFLPLKILLKKRHISDGQRLELLKIYVEEITNVYFGQALDISWHKKPRQIKVEKYLEMTRLKTGGLIRMAERMACVLSREKKLEKDIVKFSELVGIAFQIKDDCLEFTASEKVSGKSFGNDISEGKISLPVIFALKKLEHKKQLRLLKILSAHTKNKKLLKEAIQIINSTNAIEEASSYADNLINSAWQKIEKKLPHKHKKALEEFKNMTYFSVKRSK